MVTVHPLACKAAFAESPADPGAEDVPPSILRVPFDWPAVLIETRMLSTDCWERAQFAQVLEKLVAKELSKTPAGKLVRLEQPSHAPGNSAEGLKLRKGNSVRLEQYDHV